MKQFTKSPKTTFAAILIGVLTVGLFTGHIDTHTYLGAFGIVTAAGFSFSKDYNTSHTKNSDNGQNT